tara:strand:+ start:584 stop:1606 length:1023 start_codon:yes stop_codon:yes gene_type:complete
LPSPNPLILTEWVRNQTKSNSIELVEITELPGGSLHENWLCRLLFDGTDFNGEYEFVLRMEPKQKLPQSLSVTEEYALLKFLNNTKVKVPRVFFLAPSSTISDSEILFMRAIRGTTNPIELHNIAQKNTNGRQMVRSLGKYTAHIHNVQPTMINFDFLQLPSISPVHQKLLLFQDILNKFSFPLPLLEWSIRWLAINAPANQNIALSHGDLRIGNIMYENSSLTGVLDWEFASWSDPLEDIGWLCARCWRYGNDNMQVGGIGDLSDFISGYIEVAEIIPNWSMLSYWKIFATVKWALIAHQQGLRHSNDKKKQLELLLTAKKANELEHDILTQIKNFCSN